MNKKKKITIPHHINTIRAERDKGGGAEEEEEEEEEEEKVGTIFVWS